MEIAVTLQARAPQLLLPEKGVVSVCVYLTCVRVCVQRKMPGLVPPHAAYLRRGSHWIIGNKRGNNSPLNALVKINMQQISLTLILKFRILSYQLRYRSYSPLTFTQEKRPGIS